MNYTALFAGFDLAGVGLQMAGFEPLDLFEIDPKLAEPGQANSTGKYHVADVCAVDWSRYERPDLLWASPVCTRASQANSKAGEAQLDIACAEATVRAIEAWLPEWFCMENVWQYRHFKSYGIIMEALNRAGYWSQVHHLNAADFGVPQTRKRMIVRASRSGWLPPLPQPVPWVGWYEAIEDLIPELPESEFASWQLRLLPEMMGDSGLVTQTNTSRDCTVRTVAEPSATVVGHMGRRPSHMPWAFLANQDSRCGIDDAAQPSFTMVAQSNRTNIRAFIADGQANKNGSCITVPNRDAPMFTCTATQDRRPARAWLEQGRVVSMTPRALARFQSVPDSFELSGNRALDCKGVGNGVPPLLSYAVTKDFAA